MGTLDLMVLLLQTFSCNMEVPGWEVSLSRYFPPRFSRLITGRVRMIGPVTPNGYPQGMPPFAGQPGGNQSPMMVANAMLRPGGNPMYYSQPPPPTMSHRESSFGLASFRVRSANLAHARRLGIRLTSCLTSPLPRLTATTSSSWASRSRSRA